MTSPETTPAADPVWGKMTVSWKWMLGLGLLMLVLGVIGLGMTGLLTILSVLWFGVLAVVGGVAQLVDAFKYSGWKAVVSHVLLGLLYLAAGFVLIVMPVQSAWWLTLLLGATFVVTGILRIVMAVQMRGGTGPTVWLVLSGIISIALGVLIYSIVDLPTAEALQTADGAAGWFQEWGWVIGLFVAIEFIVHGAALSALAIAARRQGETQVAPPPVTPPGGMTPQV